ncbi:MAG: zinc ribbon domain-containing protein [Eggerthellaceae bacterium]|nr:zinc ribbon domain-containing protein [Eggerthellaceae bacterium]
MASDLFGSLGGIVKGLSSFMPQDDPGVQAFAAQSNVSDLRKQEAEALAEIGRMAVAERGADAFGEVGMRLKLVQANLATAEGKLSAMQQKAQEAEQAAAAAAAARRCPSCGWDNPEGTKFCQECGSPVGKAAASFCSSCGVELASGTRFCGSCGARQA